MTKEMSLLCSECWKIIGGSLMFWDNLSLFLSRVNDISGQSKLQALILMYERVKSNWHKENEDTRISIKKYLC